MLKSEIIQPAALQAPFAVSGDKNIPNYEAVGTESCSIKLGFLPITSEQLPPDGNGQAPERTDFNGMFYLTTDLRVFVQNGGLITFDSAVSTKIGGYPEGAVLAYTDVNNNISIVRSCIDNNTQNFITDPTLINGAVWELVYFNNFSLLKNVFDGQWQVVDVQISTSTSKGTHTHDLSGTIPNDGYSYEIILRGTIQRTDDSTTNTTYRIRQDDKEWFVVGIDGGMTPDDTSSQGFQVTVILPTNSRSISDVIETKALYSQNLRLRAYRRLGVAL